MGGSGCPTPNSTNAGNVRNVNTSGELNNNNANNNNGVVPDWVVLARELCKEPLSRPCGVKTRAAT
jgi:hypothetical protein